MSNSTLNRKISWFLNMRDKEPKEIKLGEFLAKGSEYIEDIKRLRSCRNADERKFIKSRLPQATISGVFRNGRKAEDLEQHSGLICVDVDAKDNPDVPDFDRLIENVLSNFAEVAYASRSVGGKGYFAIIPLAYPMQHRAQFEQLRMDFNKIGITIDSACSDVCRLRCLSYDEDAYVNEDAVPYTGVHLHRSVARPVYKRRGNFVDDTEVRVFMACKEIMRHHIDMTEDYADWISIGFSLATLGEEGREYFHIVSSQNPKYNRQETDRKFDSFIRDTGRIGIGTFFHYCKLFGVC